MDDYFRIFLLLLFFFIIIQIHTGFASLKPEFQQIKLKNLKEKVKAMLYSHKIARSASMSTGSSVIVTDEMKIMDSLLALQEV